jgi:hypothetical protein
MRGLIMDARDFAVFLKQKLLEKADSYNEILCSVSYESLEQGNRLAGIRTTLVGLANSMSDLLKEFYRERDN